MEDSLKIVRSPAPIRTQVVDTLRRAILERRFVPGQRLIERELIELTGVSRTSIREALRELSAEGLVTTMPNKGTIVSRLTAEDATELYELRAALEGLAGKLFTQNATESQRRALVGVLRSIERAAEGGEDILEGKDEFYSVLFDGAGNTALRSMSNSLNDRVRSLRALSLSQPGRVRESVEEIRIIVDAVLANDPQAAARACSFHVEQAARGILGSLDAKDGGTTATSTAFSTTGT